jgi:hypothetical protein
VYSDTVKELQCIMGAIPLKEENWNDIPRFQSSELHLRSVWSTWKFDLEAV